ncbi:MAG: Bax inhibitor-1/YccA family protein [Solirubrobacteraceae bacterium]
MKSNNPFLNRGLENTNFSQSTVIDITHNNDTNIMTLNGTMNKSFILLTLLISSAYFAWNYLPALTGNSNIFLYSSAIIGFILVIISTFKPQASPFLAPAYALVEGVFLGSISMYFNALYPGIVLNAVMATFVTFITMFALYRTRIIVASEKFKSVVIGATMAIAAFYLMNMVLRFFFNVSPISEGNSLLSIGISAVVVVVAALNLILDFDSIEQGSKSNLPKYMEWYSSMGLMITLVWLYLEILRLLSKLSSRD